MKQVIKAVFVFLFLPCAAFAQTQLITIDVKPIDPKKGYIIDLVKTQREVKVYYKSVDSIAKFSFSKEDEATIKGLIGRAQKGFDSLTNDSLAYFQRKIDSIKTANTYYQTDSASIYKSSHPAYWKLLETVLLASNDVLTAKKSTKESENQTYCFFTFIQNNEKRQVFIEALDATVYPILTKLVNESISIIKAHKQVMQQKNQ